MFSNASSKGKRVVPLHASLLVAPTPSNHSPYALDARHNLHSAVSNRNLRCKIRWRYLLVPTQPQSCVRTQYTLLIVFPQLLINLYQTSSIDDNCNCNYHHQNRQVSIEFRDLKANEQLTNPISWEISQVPKRILYCFSSIVKCDSGHNK